VSRRRRWILGRGNVGLIGNLLGAGPILPTCSFTLRSPITSPSDLGTVMHLGRIGLRRSAGAARCPSERLLLPRILKRHLLELTSVTLVREGGANFDDWGTVSGIQYRSASCNTPFFRPRREKFFGTGPGQLFWDANSKITVGDRSEEDVTSTGPAPPVWLRASPACSWSRSSRDSHCGSPRSRRMRRCGELIRPGRSARRGLPSPLTTVRLRRGHCS